jgi:hypothetical protein
MMVWVRLESGSPLVEEFGLPLRLAAGHDLCRGTALAMKAQFTMVCFGLSSQVVVV